MDSSLREQFEAINGRLLETKKAVRERERILLLMASLDESLARERETLAELTERLDESKARVEELEGVTLTAVWQKIMGSHEVELTEEVEAYAALKMAHETSEITIQSISNSLREFEAALVDLAECDEALAVVQTEQQAFLVANGRLPAEKIHQLNHKIGEGQTFLREAGEAIAVGEEALQALADLLQRLDSAKKYTLFKPQTRLNSLLDVPTPPASLPLSRNSLTSYFGMGAIVTAAGKIQPLLNLFQKELHDIDYQMVPSPEIEVPAYSEVMLEIKSRYKNNEHQRTRRIEKWRIHLDCLEEDVKQKIDFVKNKCGHRETAVSQAQNELQTLIEQHWQQGAENE